MQSWKISKTALFQKIKKCPKSHRWKNHLTSCLRNILKLDLGSKNKIFGFFEWMLGKTLCRGCRVFMAMLAVVVWVVMVMIAVVEVSVLWCNVSGSRIAVIKMLRNTPKSKYLCGFLSLMLPLKLIKRSIRNISRYLFVILSSFLTRSGAAEL